MKYKQLLVMILLVAILVRLPVAFLMGDQVTVLPGIHDQVSYDALAHSLLAGQGYSFTEDWYPFTPANTPTAHWSFAYPLYLAGMYALTGYHPLAARLFQGIVGGILICFLVYLIGRKVMDEDVGLAGAALAAVYGYFIYYSVALMTETFFIVLVLFALYLALELKEKPTPGRWILLGLALGMAGLLRQTMLLFVPFLLLWLFWEVKNRISHWWYAALPIGVIILLVIPWTIRNYLVYDQILPLNSNAGYALYASNNPNLEFDWRNEEVVVPVPAELAGQNEAELNQALTQKGIAFILADPIRYLRLTLDKTLEYFKFWPSRDSSWISNLNRVLSFGLYLPFMLGGLYLSLSHWRGFFPLYLFMVIHTSIHLLSWPSLRYRLPVDAVLMVFAGAVVVELARQLTRPSKLRNFAKKTTLSLVNKLPPFRQQINGKLVWVHPQARFSINTMTFFKRESHVQTWLAKQLRPGDVFFDVGAHYGWVSMWTLPLVGKEGAVYSFEPSPANLSILEWHRTVNNFSQWLVIPRAVSDEDAAERPFSLIDSGDSPMNSLTNGVAGMPLMAGRDIRTISIQTITLDTYCAEVGVRPNLMKIDVEGAELLVLCGARRLLGESRPTIILAVHPYWLPSGQSPAQIVELLKAYHYAVFDSEGNAVEYLRSGEFLCKYNGQDSNLEQMVRPVAQDSDSHH